MPYTSIKHNMTNELELIAEKFPKLKTELSELKFVIKDEIQIEKRILVKGLLGNEELVLIFRDEEEVAESLKYPLEDIYIFKEYLGAFYDKKVEIILSDISSRIFSLTDKLEKNPLTIKVGYKKTELLIKVQFTEDETPLKFIASHIKGSFLRGRYRRGMILTIENLPSITLENLENEIKLILNSVLFDIEYNFNIAFEVVYINSLQRKVRKRPKPRYDLPIEPIDFTYKKYIPELIDYFHTGEKVDYAPFKYICYFHIVEFFQDKSAFFIVREKLKNIILKPDFNLNVNLYVTQALNLIKTESEKNQTDKTKIQRVLRQFIDLEEFKLFLTNEELLDYFEKDANFNFSQSLILKALDLTTEEKFIESLTNRIYSIRCSIVHSNPDFDVKKAVPFVSSNENIEKLRYEIELIMEVAKTIILKTTEK
jgi:hypothetical protein